jgi:hypothetical protein
LAEPGKERKTDGIANYKKDQSKGDVDPLGESKYSGVQWGNGIHE